MNRLLIGLLLLLLLCLPAAAEENYDALLHASGAEALPQQLPGDVQELLDGLPGEPLQPETYTGLSFPRVAEQLLALLTAQKSAPLQALLALTAVVVLAAMGSGLEGMTAEPALRQTYHTVSVLASCGLPDGVFDRLYIYDSAGGSLVFPPLVFLRRAGQPSLVVFHLHDEHTPSVDHHHIQLGGSSPIDDGHVGKQVIPLPQHLPDLRCRLPFSRPSGSPLGRFRTPAAGTTAEKTNKQNTYNENKRRCYYPENIIHVFRSPPCAAVSAPRVMLTG